MGEAKPKGKFFTDYIGDWRNGLGCLLNDIAFIFLSFGEFCVWILIGGGMTLFMVGEGNGLLAIYRIWFEEILDNEFGIKFEGDTFEGEYITLLSATLRGF